MAWSTAGCSGEAQGWVAEAGGDQACRRESLEHSCQLGREAGREEVERVGAEQGNAYKKASKRRKGNVGRMRQSS